MKPSFSDLRVRKLIGKGISAYFGSAMFLWMVEYATFLEVTKTFFPRMDRYSWPCIAIAAPLLIVALWTNMLIGAVLFVRAFVRKKGRTKTVHYLFPDAERGCPKVATRILLRLAGIRSTS
jgi:hypothetical protein